jgi:hypothetical protein
VKVARLGYAFSLDIIKLIKGFKCGPLERWVLFSAEEGPSK